jgi:D-arabinose 1-dehydrogenase-like Zn-dependent alcohol dehydrogenase
MQQLNQERAGTAVEDRERARKHTKAYSATSPTAPLGATTIPRREPTDTDVEIEILFCGICHSDLHYARNEWNEFFETVYPCVPGHEIVGRVTEVGSAVTRFRAGDLVGVGCLVVPTAPVATVRTTWSSSAPTGC